MGAPVQHFELWSRNPAEMADFYSKVFDWDIQHVPEMNYRMIDTGGEGINGGIFEPQEGPLPSQTAFYITVPDLATHRARVAEAGGQILIEDQEVPGMGSFCLFADPEGRVLGLWQTVEQEEEE